MTIWYLDPEGGNDSNNGQSFANRKLTVQSITAAAVAAGDEIRCIASVDPWSVGNATWTDNSASITLAAAQTLTLDNCDVVWTAGTNVTAALTTQRRKQGTNAMQFTMGASYAGGLIGYKAFGSTQNLSAYNCISFWFYSSNTFVAATGINLRIALCSDAAGATPIASYPLSAAWLSLLNTASLPNNPWPILLNEGGSALPNGVNSIAIYADAQPRSGLNLVFDNIIATTPSNAAGHLSHGCLISKNTTGEPEFYPIQYIDGTTVNLGSSADFSLASGSRPYRGTTATVTTYALLGLRPLPWTTTQSTTSKSGVFGNPIKWTGGWDRTTMTTQTGRSWFNGFAGMFTNGLTVSNDFHLFDDLTFAFTGYTNGINLSIGKGSKIRIYSASNCGQAVSGASGASWYSRYIEVNSITACLGQDVATAISTESGFYKARRIHHGTAGGIQTSSTLPNMRQAARCVIGQIDNNTGYGINFGTAVTLTIDGLTLQNNSTASISTGSSGQLTLNRPILNDATFASISATDAMIKVNQANGNRYDYRIYTASYTLLTDQATVHAPATQSLKFTMNDFNRFPAYLPARISLSKIACFANKTITFKIWVQRTTQNVQNGIAVYAGPIAGMVDTFVLGTAANATWEQLTVTFTPTEDGVAEVWGTVAALNSSANTSVSYFSNPTVSST
jgi:hypothetical protein